MSIAATPLGRKISTMTIIFRNPHTTARTTLPRVDFRFRLRCSFSIQQVTSTKILPTTKKRFEMARFHFLKILSSNNEKQIFWLNVEHEAKEDTLSPNLFLASRFTFSTPQFMTSLRIYTTSPPQARTRQFSGTHTGQTPTFASHSSSSHDVWPMAKSSKENLTPEKTGTSSAFFLEHCSGTNCLFQEILSPQSFMCKTGILHTSVTATQPNTNELGNWFSWHL